VKDIEAQLLFKDRGEPSNQVGPFRLISACQLLPQCRALPCRNNLGLPLIFGAGKGESMRPTLRNILILAMAITLSLLLTQSLLFTQWWGGGATGRAEFARTMTDPARGLRASTRGPANEILVIQIPGATFSPSDNPFEGRTLTQLRKRGFTRAEVRGSDGQIVLEQDLE